ncbi:MAG: alpha-L-fucosidase [Draconibacterium sp.]|nr:alpha-L-fucosidase [Draconibacterium sp.]
MKTLFSLIFTLLFSLSVFAQQTSLKPELIKNFQDMKFGMFIHWGPVTLRGTEIGWSRGHQVEMNDYDNLYKEFNPVLFDADKWIKTLKDAGMKYFVFTTRHHDGFSMWDTKFSDYNIMNTPYKKDVLMELKNACDKYGIMFGTYYSICDWRHPNYPISRIEGVEKPDADMDKFYLFLKNQTKELIEKYGTKILWFDGEWEKPWTHEYGQDFYSYLKGLNENVLINNRVDKGRKGMEGTTKSKEFAGDFDTPEQRIGSFDIENPWETCMTICNQWAWKPNDKMKSYDQCMQTLLKTVGGGGNLLFNVGPMLDGRMEQRQIDRLKQMGNWLKKYGESVYGTTGGPYKPTEWMSATRKGDKIYLHVFSLDGEELKIPVPGNNQVKNCSILKGKKLKFEQSKKELIIRIPAEQKLNVVTTIVLKLNGDSGKIEPIEI